MTYRKYLAYGMALIGGGIAAVIDWSLNFGTIGPAAVTAFLILFAMMYIHFRTDIYTFKWVEE